MKNTGLKVYAMTVKGMIPKKYHGQISPVLIHRLNTCDTDIIVKGTIHQVFWDNISLMAEHDIKFEDYIDGSIFVGYKYHGSTNTDAFIKTFPKMYQKMIQNGDDLKLVARLASGYSKRKVVVSIMEQALSKMWIHNIDAYQKAIDTQVMLMDHAKSEKVRCDAANSILTHLARPKEVVNNNIVNFDMRSHAGLDDLKESLAELASKQLGLIKKGIATKDVIDIEISNENT